MVYSSPHGTHCNGFSLQAPVDGLSETINGTCWGVWGQLTCVFIYQCSYPKIFRLTPYSRHCQGPTCLPAQRSPTMSIDNSLRVCDFWLAPLCLRMPPGHGRGQAWVQCKPECQEVSTSRSNLSHWGMSWGFKLPASSPLIGLTLRYAPHSPSEDTQKSSAHPLQAFPLPVLPLPRPHHCASWKDLN